MLLETSIGRWQKQRRQALNLTQEAQVGALAARPRPSALSDAELLAILLRTGLQGLNVVQMAQKLLLDHGGWPGLQRLSFEELCHVHGFGEAKAAQVKAALEIAHAGSCLA